MSGWVAEYLRRIRYRRRWHALAAAARATSDEATAALEHRMRDRSRRRRPGAPSCTTRPVIPHTPPSLLPRA